MKISTKKIKRILVALLLSSATLSFSQTVQDSIIIKGHLNNNTRFAKVVVQKFGVGSFDIAVVNIKDGKFRIAAPKTLDAGVYRLQYSQQSVQDYVAVIINGTEKNIAFELDVATPGSLPVFTASEENQKWYGYIAQSNTQIQKIEVLHQVLAQYPNPTDKIVGQTKRAINKEKRSYQNVFTAFCTENAATWAGAMVQNRPYYFTNPTEDFRLQDFYRQQQYWDGIDASNPKLINTPLYTEHILNYLRYYMNPERQFGEEEMNNGFIKSVVTIMQIFSGNEATKKFALQYMQMGFKEIGNEKVVQYIDETYAETLAQDTDGTAATTEFENRMAGYAVLKEGNKAPNSTLQLADNQNKKLYDITNEKIIVAFWASWCPNCEAQMPLVEAYASKNKNVSVVAISLDEDQEAYAEAIKKYPSLTHSCDFKKWEGTAVTEYYIYGSPTFIVLDKDHKIQGKYDSWETTKLNL